MAEQANCRLTGADFLIQRYEAAKAVPVEQRTHDIAAFVRSYELVDEMVQALPYTQVQSSSIVVHIVPGMAV